MRKRIMMNNVLKRMLYMIMLIVLCVMCAQYVIYGQFVIGDWSGKALGTLEVRDVRCENIELNDETVTTVTNDSQIYFEVPQSAKYVCLNLSEVGTMTNNQLLTLYIPTEGIYTEESTISTSFVEGNNVFYNESGIDGIIRVDIGALEGITCNINYIQYSDGVMVTPEFLVVCVFFFLVIILIYYVSHTKIFKHLVDEKKDLWVVLFFMLLYFIWSIVIPYNQGPDEFMRYDVVKYIYDYNTLPRGDNPILCTSNEWGTSYAYSPYLAYLLCAIFMKIGAAFGLVGIELLHVARLVSVFSATLTVYFLIKISKELGFKNKYFLPCMVGLLPQYSFVTSYVNNDSFAIMTTAMIVYAWILGIKSMWNKKSCCLFVVGMALCVAAYYNCYGYLLVSLLLFVSTYIAKTKKEKNGKLLLEMLKKGIIIFVFVFLISGWWFIRNYYLYGDFFGTKVAEIAKMKYAVEWLRPDIKKSLFEQGIGFIEMVFGQEYQWLVSSARSFVAGFGYMSLFMPDMVYYFYLLVILGGCIAYCFVKNNDTKWNGMFSVGLIGSCIIVILLSLIYSYYSDFQPQGRYLLPLIVPLMLFVTKGIEKLDAKLQKYELHLHSDSSIILGAFLINMYALWVTIFPYYYW